MALGNANCWLQAAAFELPGYQVLKPSFLMNKSFQLIAFLPLLLLRIWCILYAAALNHNNDWLVRDSKYHPEVYCFWLERQSNDLALLWPSAMKASISSTVRGTHVSSSIPLAVTAMSSSIRTCHREDTVTKVGVRSASGTDSGGSTRDITRGKQTSTPWHQKQQK